MFRRSRRGMASLLCESTRGREDVPPGGGRQSQSKYVRSRAEPVPPPPPALSYLDKSGATRLTLVWLFSGVDAGVGLEVGRSVELGAADVAVVRLCACS